MDLIAAFDGCSYLYLENLSEPVENGLRIIANEAKVSPRVDAEAPVSEARPIEHSAGCRVFELNWDLYIAYSVRNESYAQNAKGEEYRGRLVRLYSRSRYLEYIAAATFASQEYPGPYRHWAIVCLNHIVDVVSVGEPTLQVRLAA